MALKIIDTKDDKQEEFKVEYPCLMECIETGYEDETLIVLAIATHQGIVMKCTDDADRDGTVEVGFYDFEHKAYWKPYNGSVTFSNK